MRWAALPLKAHPPVPIIVRRESPELAAPLAPNTLSQERLHVLDAPQIHRHRVAQHNELCNLAHTPVKNPQPSMLIENCGRIKSIGRRVHRPKCAHEPRGAPRTTTPAIHSEPLQKPSPPKRIDILGVRAKRSAKDDKPPYPNTTSA